uniref:Alpha-ketoglutarate-dependent dioxygenase alkB homolog 6-like n=1 Tax=Dermatophagoides pteronyssinus TaxID=6956 RepID=A0A6P6XYU0_DERPT
MNYLDYKIDHPLVPDSIFYIPNFIESDDERKLIDHIKQAPKPKWQYLSNRSLQVYGGYPNKNGMLAEDLPQWLQVYANKLQQMNIFDGNLPNQVLINRYEPGQGILAHEDGPLYYPVVATINTGSHTVLNFYEKLSTSNECSRKYRFSLLLWPRSLSILKQDAYQKYLHEIEEIDEDIIPINDDDDQTLTDKKIVNLYLIDKYKSMLENNCLRRQTRYSLTIRFVPKCHKLKLNKIF